MYAAMRRYKVQPGSLDEIARRAKEGFVPIIREVPGFVAYYSITVGNDGIISISIFADQAGAEESTRRAAGWVQQNLASLVQGAPEVVTGDVVVAESNT
jgi:heme-degrading monooxygenase HmoA